MLAREADQPADAGDVDETAAGLDKVRRRGASTGEGPAQVHVGHELPCVLFDPVGGAERLFGVDAGVVDETVDGTEFGLDPLEKGVDGVGVGDIGGGDDALSAEGLDLRDDRLEVRLGPGARDHIRSRLGETDCDGPADSSSTAGDDGGATR
jgi:hypothetical protein